MMDLVERIEAECCERELRGLCFGILFGVISTLLILSAGLA